MATWFVEEMALDLAACRLAYEEGWQTAVFLKQLHDESQRLELLNYAGRELQAALETTYSLLPLPLQHFFVSLGGIQGLDFSVVEAAAATGTTSATVAVYLQDLFCLFLLQQGRVNRYRLIPVLQDFARSKKEQ